MREPKRSRYTQDRLDDLNRQAVHELAVCLGIVGAIAVAVLAVIQVL